MAMTGIFGMAAGIIADLPAEVGRQGFLDVSVNAPSRDSRYLRGSIQYGGCLTLIWEISRGDETKARRGDR